LHSADSLFSSLTRLPPSSTLFPYTTLFRSRPGERGGGPPAHRRPGPGDEGGVHLWLGPHRLLGGEVGDRIGDPVTAETTSPALVTLELDGRDVAVPEGSTILDACRRIGSDQPTMCCASTLTPVNVCRVCVVEVEGSRALVPSCSRRVEEGMVVRTDSEAVRHARKVV